jgi:hypothetical protein
MFVYIEYISRNPYVSLEAFRHQVKTLQEGWAGAHDGDTLVLNVGRTWRVGPQPEYVSVWCHESPGLQRIDDWEAMYAQGEEAPWNEPFRLAGSMDYAGCYETLVPPVIGEQGRYYAEYFDFADGATRDNVAGYFADRAGRHPGVGLKLLVDRVGALGPDPRGLAFWSVPTFGAAYGLIAEPVARDAPIHDVTGGMYADLGREIR